MGDQATVQSRMEALLDIDEPQVVEEQEVAEVPPQEAVEEAPAGENAVEEGAEAAQEVVEQRVLKLKHDGVEIEKPEDEVIALAQQGYDYMQKTQKLSEDRKAVETTAQALKAQEQAFAQQVQVQKALMTDVAKITAIDSQLSQYQNLDWQSLSNTDPVEAQKLFFSYTQLKTQRDQAVNEVNQKQQVLTQTQAQTRAKQVQLGHEVLKKGIPGWGPELAKSLVSAGKEYGFDDNELSGLTDPRTVRLLHDAAQWRKLQTSKPIVDKKVAAASPVLKPGAKDSTSAASSANKSLREALKKTGDKDYAAKLIENMI